MRTIYNAANSVEAHMILNLLEQEGLHAAIQGEHLQGGMGELAALDFMSVEIAEADYAAGKAILDALDKQQPQDVSPQYNSSKFSLLLSGLVCFMLGFIVGLYF